MRKFALFVLFVLNGVHPVFAATANEWQALNQTSLGECEVESDSQTVANLPVCGFPDEKVLNQNGGGCIWNGWKIASLVFFALGIMGIGMLLMGWKMPCGNMGVASSMPCQYITLSSFLLSGLLFLFSYFPNIGKVFLIGVGSLFLTLFLIPLCETRRTRNKGRRKRTGVCACNSHADPTCVNMV